MDRFLIVNADDYGRTPGVSAGIRRAHLEGIVTSTTAMMNMPAVAADLHLARQACPQLGLGVHLVLTSGASMLATGRVSSITQGHWRFPTFEELAPRLDQLDPLEVEAEWRAQIAYFVAVCGRAPDHLDSHHHISYLSPQLFAVQLRLADEYGCAMRLPMPEDWPGGVLPETHGVPHPARLITSFYDQGASLPGLLDVLDGLGTGVSELMCHPGEVDEDLLGPLGSVYNRQRQTELDVLTDEAVRRRLSEGGITLASFAILG